MGALRPLILPLLTANVTVERAGVLSPPPSLLAREIFSATEKKAGISLSLEDAPYTVARLAQKGGLQETLRAFRHKNRVRRLRFKALALSNDCFLQ